MKSCIAALQAAGHSAVLVLFLMATMAAALPGGRERELLQRIARGDPLALRDLYDTFAGRAMAVALRVLKISSEAEEVVQETFMEVWKRAADYDEQRGGALAWIVTIARTRAIDRLRSRDSAQRATAMASAQPEVARNLAPLELAEQRQDRERVAAALGTLPRDQRVALELAYFEGLTHREIAERTGDPLGTVKTRVRLGMEKLAVLLRDGSGGDR